MQLCPFLEGPSRRRRSGSGEVDVDSGFSSNALRVFAPPEADGICRARGQPSTCSLCARVGKAITNVHRAPHQSPVDQGSQTALFRYSIALPF